MTFEELNDNDYYYAEYSSIPHQSYCIIKGKNGARPGLYTGQQMYSTFNGWGADKNIRLATTEEKHWLDECIRLNRYISKEEAMNTFVPEYVKCIHNKPKEETKDYEILSFDDLGLIVKQPDGLFKRLKTNSLMTEKQISHFKIHSVKRLSDGQIFTVGDRLTLGNITKIYISKVNNWLYCDLNDYRDAKREYIGLSINNWKQESNEELITVKLTKDKYDLLMNLLEE